MSTTNTAKIPRSTVIRAAVECLTDKGSQPNRGVSLFVVVMTIFCSSVAEEQQISPANCTGQICQDPVEYYGDSLRIHIGSVQQFANDELDQLFPDSTDRQKRQVPMNSSDIHLGGEEDEWLYYEDSVSKTYLTAEYTDFDLTQLFTAMELIQTHLQKYSSGKVQELPNNISLSKRYQGWKRLGADADTVTYGTVRSWMGHGQCYLYCRSYGGSMIRNFNELQSVQTAFEVNLGTDYSNWTTPYLEPAFWLDYQYHNGPTLEIIAPETKPGNYEYVYEKDVYKHNDTRYRRIDGHLIYNSYRQKMARNPNEEHRFGPIDLLKACSLLKPPDMFILQDYARRTKDRRAMFEAMKQASPAEPIYMGVVKMYEKEETTKLSCKPLGFKGTPSAVKKGLCGCVAKEPASLAQDVQDSVVDTIMELETHLQHNLAKKNHRVHKDEDRTMSVLRRQKRVAWLGLAKLIPGIARSMWKIQGKSAISD